MTNTDAPPLVLLCGGEGQRMGQLAGTVPKPMLMVGGKPLLWHIMRGAAEHGTDEFVIAVGHLGHVIKDYFLRFDAYHGDIAVVLGAPPVVLPLHDKDEYGWRVTCVDTGDHALTGTRLRSLTRRITRWPIVLAYGDVLADVDLGALLRYHRAHGRLATVTAARPPARFGELAMADDQRVVRFEEKSEHGAGWVSAGFFVLEQEAVHRYVPPDRDVMFEHEPLRDLVADGQLMAFKHDGYWQPVDTSKELQLVDRQWQDHKAPWKTWRS